MSHTASTSHGHGGGHGHAPSVDNAAVTMGSTPWFPGLIIVGVLCLLVVGFAAAAGGMPFKHALGAYHVGAIFAIGLSLGSMGLVMVFQQTNAGWIAACRRPLEISASLMPVALVLFAPVIVTSVTSPGALWHWMDPSLYDSHGHATDLILSKKVAFLNPTFFYVRMAIYFLIWIAFGTTLFRWSRTQDTSGDRWLTARARFVSAPGLLLFALSTAFAGFDWLMSLDYHWFSTMFGVCFFAGNFLSAVCVLVLVLSVLRMNGKLKGIVTEEHFHDLGKLMLAFTIFWAYVTFSQYFLIWYSNIPEETGWFAIRADGGWSKVGFMLAVGHFMAPFLILLWRGSKRTTILPVMAIWLLAMHATDLFFIVRPTVKVPVFESWWVDVCGWLGPVCIFLAFLARKVAANPLIPLKDPRLAESLHHKNYV